MLANAPVSYGAFEITVGIDPDVPDPLTLLDWVPRRRLRRRRSRPDRLPRRRRDAAGQAGRARPRSGRRLPRAAVLSEPDRITERAAEPGCAARHLRPVSGRRGSRRSRRLPTPAPRVRSRYPGRATLDRSVGLDDAGWARFADGLGTEPSRIAVRAGMTRPSTTTPRPTSKRSGRSSGYSRSPMSGCAWTPGICCSDGGEPITAIREWADRINHVHLKDARLRSARGDRRRRPRPCEEIWRRKAFCALGDGDIDIEDVLGALAEIGYSGWLVVEQDVLPDPDNPNEPAEDQRRNREYLRGSWPLSGCSSLSSEPAAWARFILRRFRRAEGDASSPAWSSRPRPTRDVAAETGVVTYTRGSRSCSPRRAA